MVDCCRRMPGLRRILGLVVVTVFGLPTSATAELQALKCTVEINEEATDLNIDLTVDLDHKVMTLGVVKYTIVHITDRYITALEENPNRVGSDIIVLDRITGNYKRAGVANLCTIPTGEEDPNTYCKNHMHLEARTYSGRCVRPVL